MNKSKQGLLTAVSSVVLTFLNGLFGIFIIKLIIINYGSDFNGLSATANQFINMLLIVEGGFTIATNVALFKPLSEDNVNAINGILSATKKIFNKIAIYFLIIGVIASTFYVSILKSNLPFVISFSVFIFAVLSTTFTLFYTTKYRILLQSENREYIINVINIMMLVLSQASIILIIKFKGHMLLIRLVLALSTVINGLLISFIVKRRYEFLSFNEVPSFEQIKGTTDIFVQKITSMIYSTVPILFISGTVGTTYASIYGLYNSVFGLLKSVIYAFVNAPRMGFGKLLSEKEKDYVFDVFLQYEIIVSIVLSVLLSVAAVLILPFIELYTRQIEDVNYYNIVIALFLSLITFFEIIHIPSGNMINLSGKFKVGRKIQTMAGVFIIISMVILNHFFKFYGILASILITAIILAIMEITYVYKLYFKKNLLFIFKNFIINFIMICVIVLVEAMVLPPINSFKYFFIAGFLLVIVNGILFVLFQFILNKKYLKKIYNRINLRSLMFK